MPSISPSNNPKSIQSILIGVGGVLFPSKVVATFVICNAFVRTNGYTTPLPTLTPTLEPTISPTSSESNGHSSAIGVIIGILACVVSICCVVGVCYYCKKTKLQQQMMQSTTIDTQMQIDDGEFEQESVSRRTQHVAY